MRPDPRFLQQPKAFWANVRLLSQELGYTHKGSVKTYTERQVKDTLDELHLGSEHLFAAGGTTELGSLLLQYIEFRADALNRFVEPSLMDAPEASKLFAQLREQLNPKCPLPMNKQRGKKRKPAYLTGIVNMIVEANSAGCTVDYAPRELTTITRNGQPLRTLARWVDGCLPSAVNPVAVWEIKEYYHTTSFGSRVADGVYETLLDGLELEELREHERIHVDHVLFIDSHRTYWKDGKSFLCRVVDCLNMGYVDEVFFGREVVQELPKRVAEWIATLQQRGAQAPASISSTAAT